MKLDITQLISNLQPQKYKLIIHKENILNSRFYKASEKNEKKNLDNQIAWLEKAISSLDCAIIEINSVAELQAKINN